MSRPDLAHAHDECTGNWRIEKIGPNPMVRCDRCKHAHDATPENRLAAIDANYCGIYARRLAQEGAEKLLRERENKPPWTD